MVRVGVYTGTVYQSVDDDPKECSICSTMRDLEYIKDYAAKKKEAVCHLCKDCEEYKKDHEGGNDNEKAV